MVAGVQTQYVHLKRELSEAGVEVSTAEVRPWVNGGAIESMPLPSRTRGTIRSVTSLRQGTRSSADVVWSQVALPLLPHMLTTPWLRRAPIFYAIDCTPRQLFALGEHYAGVSTDPRSAKGRLSTALLAGFFRRCRGLLPWSRWAAASMIHDYGADPAKVHVIAPGVDLQQWTPRAHPALEVARCRLLFVGGDFIRKGGPLLLDVYQRHLAERCSLDVVTSNPVDAPSGVHVHTALTPDDPALRRLYEAADLVVVPTNADCFSMAAIEAMACGLPIVTTPVGGIPEIVVDRETGYLVPPADGRALRIAIEALVSDSCLRRTLGEAGRERAVRSFNAATQARSIVEVMLGATNSSSAIAATEAV